jgi:hypothetical protein
MNNVEWLLALVQDSYGRTPILVLAISSILILPAIAIVSFLVQVMMRRRKSRAALRAARRKAEGARWSRSPEGGPAGPVWPSQAWLTIEGARRDTLPLEGQLIRIGRHQDNDIKLADSSVHRHHAMIQRTAEEDFVITDLSGKDGNGVRVNGERTEQARLTDGDVIELGRARLKFEHAPL